MPLFKFCRPDHHISRAASLRVGTLFDFRRIENDEIRDEGEGQFDFTLNFEGEVALDVRLANLILDGVIQFGEHSNVPQFPGETEFHAERLTIVRRSADRVVVRDTRVRISRSVPDCLVFCMSQLDSAEECPFDGYSDHWSIRTEAREEFVQALGTMVFSEARLDWFAGMAQELTPERAKQIVMHLQHRPVIYQDRDMHITAGNVPTFEQVVNTLGLIAFSKPARFASEREYRFVFRMVEGPRVYPPKGPIFLPIGAYFSGFT